jgi:hypothetical protein
MRTENYLVVSAGLLEIILSVSTARESADSSSELTIIMLPEPLTLVSVLYTGSALCNSLQ